METRLDPELEELLKKRGYKVIEKIGQGHTRDVYVVEYTNGSLQKRRVMKVPKKEIDETSVTTVINRSKGDLDEREVLALNKVSHPHIIEIFDAFKIGDKTVTVEEHYDAMSLEDMLKWSGPLTEPERFKHIFEQVAAGLRHLHVNEGILHRDIKPSNILIGKDTVKLSDLQTAGKLDEITESFLPTRGGTKFTSPHILNALFSSTPTAANIQSEFYALGATMYYALTRQPLFDTELVADENGRPINVNGRFIKAELMQDGQKIHSIDVEKHDAKVKERLKQVPKQYRQLLLNCLRIKNPKYEDRNAHDYFAEDLEEAAKNEIIPWKSLKKHAILYTSIAAILSGIFGGIKLMSLQEKIARSQEPPVFETLSRSPFEDGGLEYRLQDNSIELVKRYFKEIEINKDKLYMPKGIFDHELENSCGMHGISKRLGFSLTRAIQLEDDKSKQDEYGNTRYSKNLLPKEFAKKRMAREPSPSSGEDFFGDSLAWPIIYLRQCIGNSSSLPDALAEYFCDKQELFEARKKANSLSYFPTQEKPGYSAYLSPVKQRLINRTIAHYTITDNEGEVHLEILDSNNRPTKGLTDK